MSARFDGCFSTKSALRNALPRGNTVAACTRFSTRDLSSCLSPTTLAPANSLIMVRSLASLSSGSEVHMSVAFNWIPKKASLWDGPFVLSSASGNPNSLHVAMVMAKA